MDYFLLGHLIKSELAAQRAVNYAFWRSLPASATRRRLAFLEQSLPISASILEMHDAAIEEIVARMIAGDQNKPRPDSKAFLQWNEQTHQPWRYGVSRSEWYFKSFKEQKEIGGILLKLRENASEVPLGSKTLLDYYADISDEELKRALLWKPARAGIFVNAFLDRLAVTHVQVNRLKSSTEKRFLVQTGSSNLEVVLDFHDGMLSYDIFDFFNKPQSSACYEAFFGIGIGEWDLLSSDSETEAAVLFADLLKKLVDWSHELKKIQKYEEK